MRRGGFGLLPGLALGVVTVIGGGAAAFAGTDYPPAALVVGVSTSTPAAGSTFIVTGIGCEIGEDVDFTVGTATETLLEATGTTADNGVAAVTFVAPDPGTYIVTGTCVDSGLTDSTQITVSQGGTVPTTAPSTTAPGTSVPEATTTTSQGGTTPGGNLPGTGSDSPTALRTAGVLVLAGIGLLAVVAVRRRGGADATA
jgi:LPXTG-motif cell wall-anchored protein